MRDTTKPLVKIRITRKPVGNPHWWYFKNQFIGTEHEAHDVVYEKGEGRYYIIGRIGYVLAEHCEVICDAEHYKVVKELEALEKTAADLEAKIASKQKELREMDEIRLEHIVKGARFLSAEGETYILVKDPNFDLYGFITNEFYAFTNKYNREVTLTVVRERGWKFKGFLDNLQPAK